MNTRKAIRSSRVVTPQGVQPATILVEDGRIVTLSRFSDVPPGIRLIDVADSYILPGLVDTHVHVNEPGRTEWEGFATATRAAAVGGCTTIVDMPLNSIPATTCVEALNRKREAASQSAAVDYAFWGGLVNDNVDQLLPLTTAGVRGFKCFLIDSGVDEFTCVDEAILNRAMPVIASTGQPLLVHAELPGPIIVAQQRLSEKGADWREFNSFLCSRPDEAETEAIQMLIRLCRKHRCRTHIVHLSSAQALPFLEQARAEGLPITVETCPHYLYWAAQDISPGRTQFKCAPPIRNSRNREALWNALRTGVIDLVATDHSPCPPALKCIETGDFSKAWGGIASLSLALSIIWAAASEREFEIGDVVRWMCRETARLAGFHQRKGSIAVGFDADLVVFDPDVRWEVTDRDLYFRHPLSPYLGERLLGKVQMTFLRGQRIFSEDVFSEGNYGAWLDAI